MCNNIAKKERKKEREYVTKLCESVRKSKKFRFFKNKNKEREKG